MDADELDRLMVERYLDDETVPATDEVGVGGPEAGTAGHGVNLPEEMDV